MSLHGLTIGQVADAAGLTRRAVRLYEARELLPAPDRSPSGYRLYGEHHVETLMFIRRARALGLHLDDIRTVLEIRNGGIPPCATVRDLLDTRIAEIDAAIAELLVLRETLVGTRQRADNNVGDQVGTHCPIIEDGC